MARRRTLPSPADRRAQFTRLEIYREICKLRRRIEEVNALDTKQIRYGDMKINAVETNGRNQGRESGATFRSVYGRPEAMESPPAPKTASEQEGAMFFAFHGFVTGRDLVVVPGRLLVQSWRGIGRREDDLDSNSDADRAVIQMVHVGVPPQFEERCFTDSWAAWMCEQLPARLLVDKVLSG